MAKNTMLTANWLLAALHPRVAMGLAMTILSFTMVERCTGVSVTRTQLSDLSPKKILAAAENSVMCVRDRAVNYYENIRLIYHFEHYLNDYREQPAASEHKEACHFISTITSRCSARGQGGQSYVLVSCP